MNDNININKNQHNDAIEYDPKFDNKFSLSRKNKDPISVVTVSLIGGKKQSVAIITGLTCLWYSRATNIMIKRQHTKPYERNICSNKVEYSTAVGPYCITHDVKVPFCIPEFSIRKIILHYFQIVNNEGKSGIGYDMIIGRDLMVQLGLLGDFKLQVLQWDGTTVPMK